MHKTAFEIKNISRHRGAKLASERLFWGCRLLRAVRDNAFAKAVESSKAWPKLHGLLGDGHPTSWPDTKLQEIAGWLREEALTDLQSQTAELESAKDLPEYVKQHRSNLLKIWAKRWSSQHRACGLQGVLNEEGKLILDDTVACQSLSRHWADVFAYKPNDDLEAVHFLHKYARRLPPL
eukprot:206010-Karenia_brevis.AAC.1